MVSSDDPTATQGFLLSDGELLVAAVEQVLAETLYQAVPWGTLFLFRQEYQ